MRKLALSLVALLPCVAFGQVGNGLGNLGGMPAQNMNAGLTGQFFGGDFVNYSLFFNGILDSANENLANSSGPSGGFSVGGGVSLGKGFGDGGSLGLTYHGDFRDYSGSYEGSGTDQYLSLTYSRRLGRHFSLSFVEGAGMLYYNNPYYGNLGQGSNGTLTNPFSPSSRFLSSAVYLSYQQTARLSYVVGGSFILNRYSYNGAVGTTGGLGTASVIYSLSRRTTIGGTYSHDYYHYQAGFGQSTIDGGYLNLTHIFGAGWQAFVSGGITHVQTSGVIRFPQPVLVKLPDGSYEIIDAIAYNNSSNVPTIQGGVRRTFGKYNVGVSGGHGVNPGNGTYLTSSHTFFGGSVSRSFGRQALIAVNGNYSSLKSIAGKNELSEIQSSANYLTQGYSQSFLNASYSRVIFRHISVYGTYSFNHYGTLYSSRGTDDNRIIVGVAFTSRTIPFALF